MKIIMTIAIGLLIGTSVGNAVGQGIDSTNLAAAFSSTTTTTSDVMMAAVAPQKKTHVKYEYAAKIVCGLQPESKDMRLIRGFYGTAINIHNPNPEGVKFFKKLALTYPPEEQRPGKIMPIGKHKLSDDAALEVDCMDIRRKLYPNGFPPPGYIKGFVIIQSDKSLDVTAVYTTASLDRKGNISNHSGIDVEQIRERQVAFRPTSACDPGGGTIDFLDTFSTSVLSAGFNWFNEVVPPEGPPPSNDKYILVDGHLRIKAVKRQDLWGGGSKKGAPLMLRSSPKGDYCIETFVIADPATSSGFPSQPLNTQIGLFVFQDKDNWLFFGLTNQDFPTPYTTNGLMVTKTAGGSSSIVAGSNLNNDFVFLQIRKNADDWSFYWKLHHDDPWALLTTTNLSLAEHEVGMGVKTFDLDPPAAINSGQANFDFFLIAH